MEKPAFMVKFKIFLLAISTVFISAVFAEVGWSEIKVYDANDQYLGIYLQRTYTINTELIEIFSPSLGMPIVIRDDGIFERVIYFESDNCSGTAYSNVGSLVNLFHIFSRVRKSDE